MSRAQATAPFVLDDQPALARAEAFRDEPLRRDRARQEAGWPTARLVVVDADGRTPVDRTSDGPRLRTAATSGTAPSDGAVLLGERDGVAYWAVRGPVDGDTIELRMSGAELDPLDAGLLTTASAVLNWHDAARFCTRDGSPTTVDAAGWLRRCAAHGHEEYPRTDPSMICLVDDGGTGPEARVLLARQPSWPVGRFSVLAGFVEAGESLEACVAREVHEEVGVDVRDVRYLGSQPWPFPRSLMVAFHAVADPSVPLTLADGEIAEAMWFTREQVAEALAHGTWTSAPVAADADRLLLPGPTSIARAMLERWAAA